MNNQEVESLQDAMLYVTDCCLATVCHMAMLKSRGKHDFQRQIGIAQKACDWIDKFGINPKGSRAEDIIGKCTVAEWASQFILKS